MTTLTINEVCKVHTPHVPAISTIFHDSEHADSFTFCEVCENNISQFSFYDDDRGIVWSKWGLTK
jgi:hypothetical protein